MPAWNASHTRADLFYRRVCFGRPIGSEADREVLHRLVWRPCQLECTRSLKEAYRIRRNSENVWTLRLFTRVVVKIIICKENCCIRFENNAKYKLFHKCLDFWTQRYMKSFCSYIYIYIIYIGTCVKHSCSSQWVSESDSWLYFNRYVPQTPYFRAQLTPVYSD